MFKEDAEGYHNAVEDCGEDADHGPYRSYTFPNGWVMYTYYEQNGLVSFHDGRENA
jgi:hypothetical protein